MVQSRAFDRQYPLDYYRTADSRHTLTSMFGVEIDGINVQSYFRECRGLRIDTQHDSQAEGGLNDHTHYLLGPTKIAPVTLRRGFVQQPDLFDWYQRVINGIIEKKTITIKAYRNRVDNKGSGPSGEFLAPIASWVLIDALPVGWAGPAFNANDNQRAVEEMTFICDGLTRH